MPFFLSSVEKASGCTSRVFLDGECISSALLVKERKEAEIQIYSCPSICCLNKEIHVHQHIRRVKLHMQLSAFNRFVFSLFSDANGILSSTTQDLPSSRIGNSFQTESVVCRTFLFIGNQSIKISLNTTSGFTGDVFIQTQWYSHPECTLKSFSNEAFDMYTDNFFGNKALRSRNEQRVWISQDLDLSSEARKLQKNTLFDDRNPIKMGLTGAFHWNGLRLGQNIKVTKLKFWLNETCLVGFQATYIVDGRRLLGPQNRHANEFKGVKTRVFELVDDENISCIQAFSNIHGFLAFVSIVTDRGRSFAVATAAPAVSRRTQFVLRHPKAKLVGFRGSFEVGLINFGIVCELDRQIARRMPQGLVCYVCGAHSAYFTDFDLFGTHVDSCVAQLVESRHQLSPP